MNSGLLFLAEDNYGGAIECFSQVLEKDPNNIAAANNRAICFLYKTGLSKAITSLEDVIKKDPQRNLNETLVFNLCTLYDLQSDNSLDKKKILFQLITRCASDDFDISILKLPST